MHDVYIIKEYCTEAWKRSSLHTPHFQGVFLAYLDSLLDSSVHRGHFNPQSTHRVATAAFWRTFHPSGKISTGWWGWGVHVHPLSQYLPSHTKLQCPIQIREQIHSLYFISTPMYSVLPPNTGPSAQYRPIIWHILWQQNDNLMY